MQYLTNTAILLANLIFSYEIRANKHNKIY